MLPSVHPKYCWKQKKALPLWSRGVASAGLSHQPGRTGTLRLPPPFGATGTLLPKSNTPSPTAAPPAASPPSQALEKIQNYLNQLQPIQSLFLLSPSIHIYLPPALEG